MGGGGSANFSLFHRESESKKRRNHNVNEHARVWSEVIKRCSRAFDVDRSSSQAESTSDSTSMFRVNF